ncbi:CpaF family protein [Thermobacillus sp. ZCTH02-B1]|uniref:CpaF family protein n=1 Tax=Thermobacillus sp. ZCTH02-B1 TaxID=1858795 RepID=UPI0025E51482|nr:ATPase, T2SS/T4P/T4SS family [Thermobacillus sp. ZCTH02-B1]
MIGEREVRLLRERVRSRIDLHEELSDERLTGIIESVVFEWARDKPLTAADKHRAVRRLFHAFRGLDLLQPLMDDPTVTEIMINGHENIFVERNGRIERHPGAFESRERLEELIQTIVGSVNRAVNESNPIVDARLADGSRVHVVLPPVSIRGPTVTIRKFPERPMSLDDLVARGSLTAEAADWLSRLVRAKYNVFVCGGTGTGKTTFLNALAQCIPADERIVTIEDSAELQISMPNLVSLETRNANPDGKGEIPIRALVKASLRMRPDRIIVGEVRGGEAIDMLQAMNTGHDGSMSTGHGNSPRDMLSRLESMVLSQAELPLPVIRHQIASGIDLLIHLTRLADGRRCVAEITELGGVRNGDYELNVLFRRRAGVANGEDGDGRIEAGELVWTGNRLVRAHKLRLAGVADPSRGAREPDGGNREREGAFREEAGRYA